MGSSSPTAVGTPPGVSSSGIGGGKASGNVPAVLGAGAVPEELPVVWSGGGGVVENGGRLAGPGGTGGAGTGGTEVTVSGLRGGDGDGGAATPVSDPDVGIPAADETVGEQLPAVWVRQEIGR